MKARTMVKRTALLLTGLKVILLTLLITAGSCTTVQSATMDTRLKAIGLPINNKNASTPTSHRVGNATQESINVNGVIRTFLLYIPRNYKHHESALIIALHGRGGGGPGTAMEQSTKLDEKADREGFAIAYLDGLPDATGTLNWNYFYDPFS